MPPVQQLRGRGLRARRVRLGGRQLLWRLCSLHGGPLCLRRLQYAPRSLLLLAPGSRRGSVSLLTSSRPDDHDLGCVKCATCSDDEFETVPCTQFTARQCVPLSMYVGPGTTHTRDKPRGGASTPPPHAQAACRSAPFPVTLALLSPPLRLSPRVLRGCPPDGHHRQGLRKANQVPRPC